MDRTFEIRFWSKVQKTDDCWLWTGTVDRKGYGMTSRNGQVRRATRALWEHLYSVRLDAKTHVLHMCDTPRCVNPAHLYLGSNQDNCNDKVARNRQSQGESHGPAKMTLDMVRAIRAYTWAGVLTHAEIGQCLGVKRTTVGDVITRRYWRTSK